LAEHLSKQNFVIASGLARGIDTSAHEGSLKTGTIAVIAGGVDVIYPRENETLYHQIIDQGGAIISEAPLTMQPPAQHFPKRNRIITGLSNGVIVVEAGERSGSLISARTASEQGRAVMAVPGFPSDPRSIGTNDLIRNGVTLIRNADDVLEELENYKFRQSQPKDYGILCEENDLDYDFEAPPPHDSEKITDLLLSNISIAPSNIDEILRACQLSSQDVQAILFELELSGIVQRLPGNRICRIA
jgi:DNA processing protein